MQILKGIPVSPGIYVGKAFLLEGNELRVPERFVAPEKVGSELERLERAFRQVGEEVGALRARIEHELGDAAAAMIFDAHLFILRDQRLRQSLHQGIRDKHHTAEYATSRELRNYARRLRSLGVGYLAQRSDDIDELERRLLRALLGEKGESLDNLSEPVVLIAHDLGPSQTAGLDTAKVKAFATDVGGPTSHTAIIAKAHGLPAVVGLETISTDVAGGDAVIVDGIRGVVIVDPDPATVTRYLKLSEEYRERAAELRAEIALPTQTRDGIEVHIQGNIEFPEEVDAVVAQGGRGIGLYRTEFLYLQSGVMPTERDHYNAYLKALSKLGDRPLVIRTLDVGADKVMPELWSRERNPFLGCRSIRVSLKRPELFRTQLRAILRASAVGNVELLLPLISTLEELLWSRQQVREVMGELSAEKLPFNENLKIGIMIEVPAAALSADFLADYADFFSIGTNDLIQYTLAVDRGNEQVADLYTPAHPAVLRLIQSVIRTAEERSLPVAMCGEMAGNVLFAPLLLGMGLRTFSVAPGTIGELRRVVRALTLPQTRELAEEVQRMSDPKQILTCLRLRLRDILPGEEKFQTT